MSRRLQLIHAVLWTVMGLIGAGRTGALVMLGVFLCLVLLGEIDHRFVDPYTDATGNPKSFSDDVRRRVQMDLDIGGEVEFAVIDNENQEEK